MKLADQILLTISLDRLYQLNTSLDKLVAASHDFCQSQWSAAIILGVFALTITPSKFSAPVK